MAAKLRATRFRLGSADGVLPPPLPLINLPDEARLANTGVPGLRPAHLPVRRHLVESRADSNKATRDPEPILRESRMLVEIDAEETEAREIVTRLLVYEYNQPEVFESAGASADTLVFDSLFESGNLQRAERIYRRECGKPAAAAAAVLRQEYELTIHPDIKNSAYRQWFYFEVRNGSPGVSYKFSLVNLAKSGALFGSGLQPVVYSEIDAVTKGVGWRHRGTHVRYDASLSEDSAAGGSTCLSFQYEFEHENDRVYFACLQPYTYTVIVISARVHPGEPNSSWMMKGMIDYLIGPSSGALVLRKNFVFKIVPMLNPDGVVNGNTRVNLAGWDLNRKWSFPVEKLFPTVFHLKRQLATFQARDRVAIYCDLHGHSLNRNIFTYGCYNKKSGSKRSASMSLLPSATSLAAGSTMQASVKNDPRVFPMVVARNSQFFSFASCDFKVHRSKLNTARVVVNHELGVINSYTLEASFCGPDFGPRKDTQFSTWDLEEMGESWCQSLLVYFDLVAQVKEADAQLFASAVDIECDDEMDERTSMDSDLSGAEDEPIPPSQGDKDLFVQLGGVAGEPLEGYSSAPEDEGEQTAPEREQRRKSRRVRKLVKKSGSKQPKAAKAKKSDKTASPGRTGTHGAVDVGTDSQPKPRLSNSAPVSEAKKKTAKKRRKRKGGKKERSKSHRGHKKAATSSGSAEEEAEEDEDEDGEDEGDGATKKAFVLPLVMSLQPEESTARLVLPSMPGSVGRKFLKPPSSSDERQQQNDSAS
ncbi:hypothetical protein PybrP1_011114 [[Pythium] brassicae (nom. inval.)]|nr:hypothetical protein PybrP1_011114 [[Pythium] brassicae (nom. inval.)]